MNTLMWIIYLQATPRACRIFQMSLTTNPFFERIFWETSCLGDTDLRDTFLKAKLQCWGDPKGINAFLVIHFVWKKNVPQVESIYWLMGSGKWLNQIVAWKVQGWETEDSFRKTGTLETGGQGGRRVDGPMEVGIKSEDLYITSECPPESTHRRGGTKVPSREKDSGSKCQSLSLSTQCWPQGFVEGIATGQQWRLCMAQQQGTLVHRVQSSCCYCQMSSLPATETDAEPGCGTISVHPATWEQGDYTKPWPSGQHRGFVLTEIDIYSRYEFAFVCKASVNCLKTSTSVWVICTRHCIAMCCI